MATLIECGEEESVPLTYVPCTNGILKTGSVALYDGREFRVEKLVFEGRAKKAFAHLTSVLDEVCIFKMFKKMIYDFGVLVLQLLPNKKPLGDGQMVNLCLFQDETVKRPAVKVRLLPRPAVENYMKEEVFDFFLIDAHPVNVAFATYAALKRMVGLSTKNSFTWAPFAPSTPLIRALPGLQAHRFTSYRDQGGGQVLGESRRRVGRVPPVLGLAAWGTGGTCCQPRARLWIR